MENNPEAGKQPSEESGQRGKVAMAGAYGYGIGYVIGSGFPEDWWPIGGTAVGMIGAVVGSLLSQYWFRTKGPASEPRP